MNKEDRKLLKENEFTKNYYYLYNIEQCEFLVKRIKNNDLTNYELRKISNPYITYEEMREIYHILKNNPSNELKDIVLSIKDGDNNLREYELSEINSMLKNKIDCKLIVKMIHDGADFIDFEKKRPYLEKRRIKSNNKTLLR